MVFTNDAYGMYLLTGQVARMRPAKRFNESQTLKGESAEFKRLMESNGQAHLVWFDGGSAYEHLSSVAELGSVYELEPVVTTASGTIYTIRNDPGRSASSAPEQ